MAHNNQQLEFFHLTEADGLSHSVTNDIVQDDLGFIWIGSFSGLNRFDGYDFKIFRHDPADPHSLSDDMIRAMTLDRKRNLIWLATKAGGLNKFDPRTERFTRYRGHLDNAGRVDQQFPTSTSAVYVDRRGIVWVGGDEELIRFDPESETFHRYRHDPDRPESLGLGQVHALAEDQAGRLWIANRGGGGLSRFDPKRQIFIHYPHDPDDLRGPGSRTIHTILVDRAGGLWVGTEDQGLSYLAAGAQTFVRYRHDPYDPRSLSHNYIRHLMEDRAGNLWVGTLGGLNKLDRASGAFVHYRHNPTDPATLGQDRISRVFEDRMGGLWVSTFAGVNYCYPEQQQFTRYRHDHLNANSLDDNTVKAIYETPGEILWLGTTAGLNRFDRPRQRFKHYRHDPRDPHSLGDHVFVATLLADVGGRFWIGLWGGELHFFDPQSEQFWPASQDPVTPTPQVINNVLTMYKDRQQQIWVGSYHQGLYHFDQAGHYLAHYRHHLDEPASLSGHSIHCIYEDRSGHLWVGAEDSGLDRFDPVSKTFTHYRYRPHEAGCISSDRVYCLFEDQAGIFWIGTGNGLNRFDRASERFSYYRLRNQTTLTVYGILEDQQTGHLWLGTEQGLVRFDPQTERFTLFDLTDASQDTFNQNAYYQNAAGEMFFGGMNGLTVFYPEQITLNSNVPPVVLTNFLLFNKPAPIGGDSPLKQAIWATDALTLSAQDYSFAFEFAALSYVAPWKNRYRYKLEGFDQDWHEVGSRRRYAAYSNLPAGEYCFRVIGSNNHGVWNKSGVSLKIKVAQPLWEKLRLEKEAAEAASRAKSKFLSSMTHELRTPLNAILGYAQLLQRSADRDSELYHSLQIIHDSGRHLLTLINDVLDIARIETGKIELTPRPVDLAAFLRQIVDLISFQASAKRLHLVYHPPKLLPQAVLIDAKRLRQVLFNLLGNAIKFTATGQITFAVDCHPLEPGRLSAANPQMVIRFTVSDTGSGIAPQQLARIFQPFEQAGDWSQRQKGIGLGLAISQELVTLMGGQIQVESESGTGSTFWFTIQAPLVTQSSAAGHGEAVVTSGNLDPAPKISSQALPPAAMLEQLLVLARLGDMDQIQTEALDLANQDRQYAPLARQLVDLAEQFDVEAIRALIEAQLAAHSALPARPTYSVNRQS